MTIDTVVTPAAQPLPQPALATPGRMKWLLLIHHLPPKPDYLRVKVRRRLGRFGAVLVKPSVYALPCSEDSLEDFEWLRREIADLGGEAIVCATEMLSGLSDEALTAQFVTERQQRYHQLAEEAAQTLRGGMADAAARNAAIAVLNKLRRRLAETRIVDFFGAPGREHAESSLGSLELAIFPATHHPERQVRPVSTRGRLWVTRRGVKVDRIASAWLIRRFIDPDAQFLFVDPEDYTHGADQLRFDMYEGEFTHELDLCTFEKLLTAFSIDDSALQSLSEIVHDIDYKEVKFGRPERPGVEAMIDGITAAHAADEARLAAGSGVLDALYLALGGARG